MLLVCETKEWAEGVVLLHAVCFLACWGVGLPVLKPAEAAMEWGGNKIKNVGQLFVFWPTGGGVKTRRTVATTPALVCWV